MEETLDVTVNSELAESILRNSGERLTERIYEMADGLLLEMSDNELREFQGLLKVKLPTVEEREEGGITAKDRREWLRGEEIHWRSSLKRMLIRIKGLKETTHGYKKERNKANDFTCKLQCDVSIFSNRRQSDFTKCSLMISQREIMISRLV